VRFSFDTFKEQQQILELNFSLTLATVKFFSQGRQEIEK
jgi:hypothetical protein